MLLLVASVFSEIMPISKMTVFNQKKMPALTCWHFYMSWLFIIVAVALLQVQPALL